MDIRLYQGDCLDVMRSIPDGSVDMVLCDLPYGTTACKWDSVIPLEPLWEQYNRLLKHQGSVVLFGSEPFSSSLRMSNLSAYKYDWVWKKNRPTGFQHAQNMPLKDYETISVFSKASMGHDNLLKEKRMWYNPQGITHCGKEWKRTASKFGSIVGKRKSHKNFGIQEFTGFPTMVLEYDKDETNYHPTQKPVALLAYLIKTYTNGGGDSFGQLHGFGVDGCRLRGDGAGLYRHREGREVFCHRARPHRQTPRPRRSAIFV